LNYCEYPSGSCTYETICCNGPCDTSIQAQFGLCPP
jgi:hypothetical protein